MPKIKETAGEKVFHWGIDVILIFTCIISLYPVLYVLAASFSNPLLVMKNEITIWPKGFTLIGYEKVFTNPDIWNGYMMTILYTVIGTALNVLMTLLGAYPLSRKDFYGRKFWTVFITFTMFFGGGMIPAYLLIQKIHLYNNFWVMIIPVIMGTYNVIIMRTFINSNVPVELQESAVIDGANDLVILLKVVVPLSIPVMAVMCLFYGVDHWNEYFRAMIYLQDRKLYPLQLILREILVQNIVQKNVTQEMLADQKVIGESIKYALIIVATVPILMVYPFIQKYFVKGMLIGSIKA